KTIYSETVKAQTVIDKKLTLDLDTNDIKLVARNDNALAGHEDAETATLSHRVKYVKIRVADGAITLAQVVPLYGKQAGKAEVIQPGEQLEVPTHRILVKGHIKGQENLSRAAWDFGDGSKSTPLARFKANARDCPINDEIELKRGAQIVRFLAGSPNSEPVSRILEV